MCICMLINVWWTHIKILLLCILNLNVHKCWIKYTSLGYGPLIGIPFQPGIINTLFQMFYFNQLEWTCLLSQAVHRPVDVGYIECHTVLYAERDMRCTHQIQLKTLQLTERRWKHTTFPPQGECRHSLCMTVPSCRRQMSPWNIKSAFSNVIIYSPVCVPDRKYNWAKFTFLLL